ncbi:4Fe-4S cluster-binding domain-containing protein [Candidatus Kuenenbacteria bacterium]|nr:4Fe-4S cluster-binding domain-containing protein [Candidatus Kuenenbacteria bacterium]
MLCNHNCFYCYNPTEHKELSIALAKERIRNLVAMVGNWGTFDITFTGGEPFINKEVLYEGISAVAANLYPLTPLSGPNAPRLFILLTRNCPFIRLTPMKVF